MQSYKKKWEYRRDKTIIPRQRFERTGLNRTLFKTGIFKTGRCDICGQEKTIEHVMLHDRNVRQRDGSLFKTTEG